MTQPDIRRLSGDERRQLALDSASVFERTAFSVPSDSGPRPDGFVPSDRALAVLRNWIQVFSPGDPEAFERRLTWDDLTLADVARALSTPPATVLEPDWLEWVDAIARAARAVDDDRAGGPIAERFLFAGTTPPPFLELLVPVLRAARPGLAAVALDRAFQPAAIAAIEAQLLKNVALFAELALLDELHAFTAADRGGYAEFVTDMLTGGLVRFVLDYPVLARQLALLASRWVAATAELAGRLDADRGPIAAAFCGGRDPGPVAAIEPALSDPHHGGRRVAILTFADGTRLVYKPRAVSLDAAFQGFLAWTAERGLLPAQRRLATLDRGDYGWVEYVEQEAFATPAQVALYYRRAGALLALTYVLRAKDLHMENVIATREGPVLIDLELTLQPVTRGTPLPAVPAAGDHAETDGRDGDHALTSGLLTLVESSGGQVFDIGGLRGTGTGTAALAGRTWHALERDDIHYTDEKTFTSRVRNAVVLDGVVQTPDASAAEVERGFEDAYRFLLAHRDEILVPGGALSRFAGCPTRVLPRPTSQYAALNYLLARPQYQKDGCRWSAALDALNRSVSQSHDRPEVWPVLVAERRALELLDVPHFTVPTDQTAVYAGHRLLLEGYFSQSGLDAVIERFHRLSPAHLEVERDRVGAALAESIHSRFTTEPVHDPGGELDVTAPEFLSAHAVWIARELLARGTRTARGLEWPGRRRPGPADAPSFRRHHLYDGSTGPALFLAAVAAETGDEACAAAAREALGPLRADVADADPDRDDLGVASGLGSIVYALAMTGSLLGDEETTALAATIAAAITPERIAADTALDLVAGCAGAALGLLALHRTTRQPRLLEQAVCCGDRLVETAVSFEGGSGWRTADGRVFTGFAHGVAGIAYALGRIYDATGDRRFGRAAAGGYRYVAARFLEGAGNWPILGEPAEGQPLPGPMMTAWCHGAPGIALATASGTADTVEPRLLEELESALKTAVSAAPHKANHVCCGNLGRCESLFTAGRRLMRRDAFEGARRLARVVIARARQSGHFRLTANGFEYRIFNPGFFRGLSGIGYSLLHLASPAHLPSVAAFEAPPPAAARVGGSRLP